jgi:hypothetical protein
MISGHFVLLLEIEVVAFLYAYAFYIQKASFLLFNYFDSSVFL